MTQRYRLSLSVQWPWEWVEEHRYEVIHAKRYQRSDEMWMCVAGKVNEAGLDGWRISSLRRTIAGDISVEFQRRRRAWRTW